MGIIASCGHHVESVDVLFDLQVKGHDAYGNPCMTFGVYCKECADNLEQNNQIIYNRYDEQEWLMSEAQQEQPDLYTLAKDLAKCPDVFIAAFAKRVCDFISQHSTHQVTIMVDTNSAFTLLLGDSTITGIGKVEFPSVDDALMALNSAKIVWVRPIKAHTPDGLYLVNEDDYDHCYFFIHHCQTAALSLLDGTPSFDKVDGSYSLSVLVE